MQTPWSNSLSLRTLLALVLLLLGPAQTTRRVGRRFGDGGGPVRPHLGHGVAEGNGPNGLYGFFGCLFSYAVCQDDEICVNDNLFGSCQRIGSAVDGYKYHLSENQLRQLEDEVERLVEGGYKWTDLYTQCVLGNVLLAFELNQHYDQDFCKHKARPTPSRSFPLEKEEEEEMEDLDNVVGAPDLERESVHLRGYEGGGVYGRNSDFLYPKRSADPLEQFYSRRMVYLPGDDPGPDQSGALDFVAVHKYQKNRKRESLIGRLRQRQEDLEDSEGFPDEEEVGRYSARDFLDSLSPRELDMLKSLVNDGLDRGDRRDGIGVEDKVPDEEEMVELTFEPQPIYDLEQKRDEDEETKIEKKEEEEEEAREKLTYDPAAFQVEKDDRYYDDSASDAGDQNGRLDNTYGDDDDVAAAAKAGVALEDAPLMEYRNSPDNTDEEAVQSVVSEWSIPRTNNRESTLDETLPNIEKVPDSGLIVEPIKKSDEMRVGEVTTFPAIDTADTTTTKAKYDIVAANYAYLSVMPKTTDPDVAANIVTELQELLHLPQDSFSDLSTYKGDINFRINRNENGLNASTVAAKALSLSDELKNRTGIQVIGAGVGHVSDAYISVEDAKTNGRKYFLLTFVLCGVIAGVVLAVILLYVIRRHRLARQKLARLAQATAEKAAPEVSKDYQELCRHHMQSKLTEKPEPLHVSGRVGSVSAIENAPVHSPSSRSSTSSWSEEPVTTSMDISTGHIVLSYMEDHLKNKDRLDEEWQALCAYEPEISAVTVASLPQNERRNRYGDILPYDHSRVVLHAATNMTGSDYINATTIMDHDPRNPAYLATQGPLPNTVADFWQMVWEQGSVVIVNLTKLTEQGTALCHCYWPSEGSDLYHIYEVHLVSEHIWCEDYLVRSFYLKNLQTNETRTVTQFHFLTWSDMKIPGSSKALLDFRRKVNKSYRGRSCPILVHCSDGAGRSGTYCLIDMVLNRMTKGAKEIDIAATLEHIRDQRMQMVKTKEQFQFVLATVAEEVHAILRALPQ